MRWWCAAAGDVAWTWAWRPYPGVWLFILAIAAFYTIELRRAPEPADPTQRGEQRRRIALFAAGLLVLWGALDWPLGPLGSGYLASAHMAQYLLVALVAPPLMLLGLPRASVERLSRHPRLLGLLENVTQPIVAFFIFNVVISVVHWPAVVDAARASQAGSFALDLTWLGAGLILWWPVIVPVPDWPRFTHLWKLAYLGLNGVLVHPTAMLLFFARYPAYRTYELAPPIPGTSPLSDQQLAAGVMKLGSALVLVVAMGIIFASWVRVAERAANDDAR